MCIVEIRQPSSPSHNSPRQRAADEQSAGAAGDENESSPSVIEAHDSSNMLPPSLWSQEELAMGAAASVRCAGAITLNPHTDESLHNLERNHKPSYR